MKANTTRDRNTDYPNSGREFDPMQLSVTELLKGLIEETRHAACLRLIPFVAVPGLRDYLTLYTVANLAVVLQPH